MLLTETIKKSTSAIKKRRATLESKQSAETYAKALAQLAQAVDSIKVTLDCTTSMKANGIVSTPVIDAQTRTELLECFNACGNGIQDVNLSLDTVKLLRSKGDTVATQVKIVWKDASKKYSEGTKGYLSIIGGLSDDPKRARDLADAITKAVEGDPTIKVIESLVSNVHEAKQITDAFSLNPEIENFLKRVSAQQATVADLTPNVHNWLKEKHLTSKLKLRF